MAANTQDYAVIVGVKHYEGLSTLKGPEKDAKRFYDWITEENGGYVPASNCHLIISEEKTLIPIQTTIDECFGDIITKTNRSGGRRLYFYFSGHGLGLSWNDTALVLPRWTNFYRNHALSSAHYRTTLIDSGKFSEIFFFFDCCRNRKIAVNGCPPLFGYALPNALAGACKSYVYSASEFNNEAYEALEQSENGSLTENGVRGLFTDSLLRGLRGAAEKGGEITSFSLASHLQRDLPRMAAEIKKVQVPNIQLGNLIDTTIVSGLPKQTTNVNITFNTNGKKALLEDSDSNILKVGLSDTNTPWTLTLEKGLYIVYYEGDKSSEKGIKIDGTLKSVSYDI